MSAKKESTRLSQAFVVRLMKSDKWSEIWDTEVKGFHIRKTSQSASYRLAYRHPISQKRHVLTLGHADKISCLEAKKAAAMTVAMHASQALSHKVETVHNQCAAALPDS